MKITFKRKQYRTYEVLPEEEELIKKIISETGVDGFSKTVLASSVDYTLFEDQWELLTADKEELKKWQTSGSPIKQ